MRDVLLGWLLRGKCDIRLFDGLVLLAELGVAFFVLLWVDEKVFRKWKRRK